MNQRTPQSRFRQLSNVMLHYYEWPGIGDPILFLHATGFHARCWDQVIHRLNSNRPIVAVDTRGHGLSEKTLPPFDWSDFGEDLVELIESLQLSNVTVVGHSMGGYLALYLAGKRQSLFTSVLAIDPVVPSPGDLKQLEGMQDLLLGGFEHPTAKRRNDWSSENEMFAVYARKLPFCEWDEEVLRDYCKFGLQTSSVKEGRYELACPPVVEAAIYLSSGGAEIYDLIEFLQMPVRILRAMQRGEDDSPFDFRFSPTWADLVNQIPRATESYLSSHTHFIPMQDPTLVAKEILSLL